jgi:hypothetical protein
MQSRTLKNLVTIFSVIFILASCTSDYIVPDPPAAPAPPDSNESIISYSGSIQPIFTAKCITCHAQGKTPPILTAGRSYQSLMSMPGMIDTVSPGNSTLYQKMATGGSMAPYCTKADADSTYKWIRQGARNN